MLFDTYDRQGNDATDNRSTRIAFVAEYETDGSMKFITSERFRTLVSENSCGTVRPKKLEFDEALQEAFC